MRILTRPLVLLLGLLCLLRGLSLCGESESNSSASENCRLPVPSPAAPASSSGHANPVLRQPESAGGESRQPAATESKAKFVAMSMDELDDRYPLKIGDRVSFRIVEDRDEPKPLVVTDNGELEVPYIGRVSAVGKPCKKLAHEIKNHLVEKEFYLKATVLLGLEMFKHTRGRIYITGQVRASGPIEIPGDEDLTLSKSIIVAGGFGDFADRRHVKLYRKNQKGMRIIDLTAVLEKGQTDLDVKLEPEDIIFVPERMFKLE